MDNLFALLFIGLLIITGAGALLILAASPIAALLATVAALAALTVRL